MLITFFVVVLFSLAQIPGNNDAELLQMSLSRSFSQCPQTAAQKTTTVISASEENKENKEVYSMSVSMHALIDSHFNYYYELPVFSVGGSTLWNRWYV